MENGLTSPFTSKVTPMPQTCFLISCKAPKSTRTSIGMIIIQINRPTGRLTRAISSCPTVWNTSGSSRPRIAPMTIHRHTHTLTTHSPHTQIAFEDANAFPPRVTNLGGCYMRQVACLKSGDATLGRCGHLFGPELTPVKAACGSVPFPQRR